MRFFKNEEKDVLKRRSYYGFSRNYPGTVGGSKYLIGESRTVKKKDTIRRVLIALMIAALFILSFIITSICINISEKPIEANVSLSGTVFHNTDADSFGTASAIIPYI